MRGPIPILVLVLVAWSGCTETVPTPEPPAPAAPWYEAQALGTDLPVMLLHGYNVRDANDGTQWDTLESSFRAWGWDGPFVRWAYYACDVVYDGWSVDDHGQHERHAGGPDAHVVDDDCRAGGHDSQTPIEHLAHHLAWAIHDRFTADERCVTVVAHSMGGVLVRTALARVEEGHPDFPDVLCVKGVATLGTPHAGYDGGSTGFTFCLDLQCDQLRPTSAFMAWLQDHPMPQGAGGTKWTLVGSQEDGVISGDSALSMTAHDKVLYLDGNGIHHSLGTDYMEVGHAERTAHVLYAASDRGVESRQAPWPLRWVHNSFTRTTVDWAPEHVNQGPGLEWATPEQGAYEGTTGDGFSVEVECLDDPEGETVYVDFVVDGTVVETDTDLWGTSPSHTFTLPGPGTFTVEAACRDPGGASSGGATWTVTLADAPPAPADGGPDMEWADPEPGSYWTTVDEGFPVEVECLDDPEGDPVYVEFIWNSAVAETDRDYWGTSPSYTFYASGTGTATVAARCVDDDGTQGASSQATWTVEFR